MKKIIKKILRFFKGIFRVFDKLIITPIMKIVIKISNFFEGFGKGLEKIFTTKSALLVISLVLAFSIFYFVDKNSNITLNNYAESIHGQPVEAIYNEEAYVIEGLPQTADVILIGRSSDIFLAKQFPSKGISVDLRELTTGTHKVELKYQQALNFIEYQVIPSYVTVVINDKISATRELGYEILHRENLDNKLDISDVTLEKTEVTIKGSEKTLKSVAYVKALIDVNNIVKPEAGLTSVKGAKLVAYDENGNVVDVEILPKTVEAKLTLTTSNKMVPINVIPEGELALGYAIESLTPSSNSIMVYGNEETLKNIENVPVYVDVSNLNETKTFNVNIQKPAGVREVGLKTLSIKVTVTKEEQIEVPNVSVMTINLDSSLTALVASDDNSKEAYTITAIVKGSSEAIKKLDKTKVIATVDLKDYKKPGEYEVDVKVTGDDLKLTYAPKTKKIKINIYKK